MGELIQFKKKVTTPKPSVKDEAIVDCVDYLRGKLYAMDSTEARVQVILIIISQLTLWIIKSGHYEKPGEIVLAWVGKQIQKSERKSQYTVTKGDPHG